MISSVSPKKGQSPFILSLDIGTSSIKAGLFDRLGRSVTDMGFQERLEIRRTKEGASEIDADELLRFVWNCVDHVVLAAGDLAKQIYGVACCTFVGNILGVDQKGVAV